MRVVVLLFILLSNGLSAQDSIALQKINAVFGDLPVTEPFATILAKAERDSTLNIIQSKDGDVSDESVKIVFDSYPFHKEINCTNCYLSVLQNDDERILRLTLNFKDFDQSSYNDFLKKTLAHITPYVRNIEQNFGAGGSLETWLLFSNSTITPRIQIAEPAKNFTQLIIDYVSVE